MFTVPVEPARSATNDCLSATHNIHGAAIRNRQCARANTIRRFELAEGKTSLTMATDLAVRTLENRWIRFDR